MKSRNRTIGLALVGLGMLMLLIGGVITLANNIEARQSGLGDAANLSGCRLQTLNDVLGTDLSPPGRATQDCDDGSSTLPVGFAIGGMIAAAAGGVLVVYDKKSRDTKNCPHCAEKILADALICKHCRQPL